MKKILFLSSAFIMTTLGAYAADGIITGGAGTCTVDVLGVSDNNATANTIAVWSINEYTLTPGEYLNVTETSVDKTTCPAGSYCVGGDGFTVDNAATSIEQCPTEYPNSAAGAGAQNQCYTACTVATANIAHATAVGGNDYFGDGADACYATDCDTGYHVDGDVELVEQTPVIPVNYETAGNDYGYISADGNNTYRTTENGLTANNTWAANFDYGTVYGHASCQSTTDPASVYFFSNIEAVAGGTMSMEEFRTGVLAVTSEAKANVIIDLAKAYSMAMTGQGDMTEAEIEEAFAKFFVTFSESSDKNYATDSTGQYCYCQMDGFAPMNGDVLGEKTSVTSAPWVFDNGLGSAGDCASHCAGICADFLRGDGVSNRAFRAAVFGSLGALSTGVCAANTINIDWDPDNGAAHIAGQCTYDDAITLPADPEKPGYTFTGWKLKSSN